MNVKDTIEIKIEDMTEEGQGLGRVDNRVVFVTGAVIGETVSAQVTSVKKGHALAKVIKVIEASPDRVEPPCPYAYYCGGCSVQQIKYEKQLELKEKLVHDSLARIGGLTSYDKAPIIGMANPYHYRNKAVYPFGKDGDKIVLGFYKPKSHKIIPIDNCLIQHQSSEAIIKAVTDWANTHKLTIYDEKSHTGLLRHLFVRTTQAGEHMIGLIINAKVLPHQDTLIEALEKTKENITSLLFNIQTQKGNTIMTNKTKVIKGRPTIIDTVGDLSYELSMNAFFQVNPEQTQKLYSQALTYADLKGTETVWDIYSGAGTISLALANKAKYVYGNEINTQTVENAKANAKRNNITNVEFIEGPAEHVLQAWTNDNKSKKVDLVVLDPPRKGADPEALKAIINMNPAKIVYVSCKPSTLARDLKVLVENGYEVVHVTPVDMFPHTMHVETVVKLTRV